jgi:osmotically-inducible protein OsmY
MTQSSKGRERHTWTAGLLACLVAPALVACHGTQRSAEPADAGATTVTAATVRIPETAEPAPLTDASMSAAIKTLLGEPVLRAEDVKVDVTAGVATLSGSVPSILAKEQAVGVAGTIRGVRAVVDQVTVATVVTTDDQLRNAVTIALQSDSATGSYKIAVTCQTGTVTLKGIVGSWQEDSLACDVAKAVPGVRALVDRIQVHFGGPPRSADDVAAEVRLRLANDVWLAGDTFAVDVARHEKTSAFPDTEMVAHVVGTVGSIAQKTRARQDAWVIGINTVDDDSVIVDPLAHADQGRATEAPTRSDPQIEEAVRDSLRIDARLKARRPQAWVRNREVVLTGIVDDLKAQRAAEADAKNTLGVWRVRDETQVWSNAR